MTGPTRAIDALHEHLLGDVRDLVDGVDTLKAELPKVLADIDAQTKGLRAAVQGTSGDVEAMGKALVAVLRSEIAEQRSQTKKAQLEAALLTKATLESFTKYFWLLCGLVGIESVLLVVVLTR